MRYFVYVIYNIPNDKIYIGQTADLGVRLKQHNDYSFKKFTSRYLGGWSVVYQEVFLSRKKAMVREKELKSYQGRKFIRNIIDNKIIWSIRQLAEERVLTDYLQ